MTPRVLLTGSRDWVETQTIFAALRSVRAHLGDHTVLVHGDCPTGADAIAHQVWSGWGLAVEPHPADWATYGRAAGPRRNRDMVNLGADLCLAFPKGASRGTRGCMALARAAGIPTVDYGGAGKPTVVQ